MTIIKAHTREMLSDKTRAILAECDQCMQATCTICKHEPCPICTNDCDHPECLVDGDEPDSLKKTHVWVFTRCPKHLGLEKKAQQTA